MMDIHLPQIKIILASKSPRRQQLLKETGLSYELRIKEVDESYPCHLKEEEIALFIAEKKANEFKKDMQENELLITADTIVCLDHEVLGKPIDVQDAISILSKLSGKMHKVITGVSLASKAKTKSFAITTKVYFKPLTIEEITSYVKHYQPFDKAGAYGIQEWIGYIGIEKIEGSYFNVMGLPVKEVYEEIMNWDKQ
jgi:septum formation protein